jgi:hypothetical protein
LAIVSLYRDQYIASPSSRFAKYLFLAHVFSNNGTEISQGHGFVQLGGNTVRPPVANGKTTLTVGVGCRQTSGALVDGTG